MAGSLGCANVSVGSTQLPGIPYLVQMQKAELWLLQQCPPSNWMTDILGNTDSRSHLKHPQSEILIHWLLMGKSRPCTDGRRGQNLRRAGDSKAYSKGDGRRAKGPPLSYMETSTGPISLQENAEGVLHGKDHIDYQPVSSVPKAINCQVQCHLQKWHPEDQHSWCPRCRQ